MFYTVLPLTPPIIAVQPGGENFDQNDNSELIERLSRHFMVGIALVDWNEDGLFKCQGISVPEKVASDDDLTWREFDLPPLPEIPF